jgi:hypothetical protein
LEEKMMKNARPVMALLAAGVLSSGCGLPEGALGETPMLSGQIEGWSGGTGYAINVVPLTQSSGETVLATGTVDASGAFSIELPSPDAIAQYLMPAIPIKNPTCSAVPTANPSDLKIVPVALTAKKAGATSQVIILFSRKPSNNTMAGDVGANFVYTDRDGDVTGQTKCDTSGSSVTGDQSWHLRKGWNIISSKILDFNGAVSNFRLASESHTGALPPEVKWWTTN